jgi:RNA:NAD 2'-phosphotransferase (TPT1/KptA family)
MPKNIKIASLVVILLLTTGLVSTVYNNSKNLYNSSKHMELQYKNIEQSQIVKWDNYYLNFKEQSENVKLTKEGFIELAQIVMSSRKDGQNLAWKWVQENQNIPFEDEQKLAFHRYF